MATGLENCVVPEASELAGIVRAINLYLINLESESDEDEFVREIIIQKCANQWRRERNMAYRRRVAKRRRVTPLSVIPSTTLQETSTVPLPRFSAGEFKRHLGMNKVTFEKLAIEVGPLLRRQPQGLTLDKHLTIALWLFANKESFGSVCDRFAISTATGWTVLKWTMDALHRLDQRNRLVSWPSGHRAHVISQHYRSRHGFPGVIGCLGARRVLFQQQPTTVSGDQRCDADTGSLVLQAVCDERATFVDVYVTRVSSNASKHTVFQNSPLADRLTRDQDFPVNGNGHLIADSSYSLHKHLLVPYDAKLPPVKAQLGYDDEAQRYYDAAHARCLISVDRAFARLLCRFRGLAPVDVPRLGLAPDFVSACCVLHNFCIARGDRMSKEEAQSEAKVIVDELQSRAKMVEGGGDDVQGEATRGLEMVKRDSIANLLSVEARRKP